MTHTEHSTFLADTLHLNIFWVIKSVLHIYACMHPVKIPKNKDKGYKETYFAQRKY